MKIVTPNELRIIQFFCQKVTVHKDQKSSSKAISLNVLLNETCWNWRLYSKCYNIQIERMGLLNNYFDMMKWVDCPWSKKGQKRST